jgi:hypothetical protein
MTKSDKIYWHKFINFYEHHLPNEITSMVEIGIFRGDSIKYWRNKFKNAKIYGIDVIPIQPEWPQDENIKYIQADQSDINSLTNAFKQIENDFELVVEDGSHHPLHQKTTLMYVMSILKENCFYILEDIHTSHPRHKMYQSVSNSFIKSIWKTGNNDVFMSLHCVLFLKHVIDNDLNIQVELEKINYKESIYSKEDLLYLHNKIKTINFYKRNDLPDYCYSCNTSNFNFNSFKCKCGTDLYLECDSMTVVIGT